MVEQVLVVEQPRRGRALDGSREGRARVDERHRTPLELRPDSRRVAARLRVAHVYCAAVEARVARTRVVEGECIHLRKFPPHQFERVCENDHVRVEQHWVVAQPDQPAEVEVPQQPNLPHLRHVSQPLFERSEHARPDASDSASDSLARAQLVCEQKVASPISPTSSATMHCNTGHGLLINCSQQKLRYAGVRQRPCKQCGYVHLLNVGCKDDNVTSCWVRTSSCQSLQPIWSDGNIALEDAVAVLYRP
eukprot:6135425-Pleurochrysis_carterae.AAC.1